MIRLAVLMSCCAALAACGQAPTPAPALDPREVEAATRLSAALADRFQAELRGRLDAAMAEGGPVGAIKVCAEDAPAIARRLSAESGAIVRRTALRTRNPAAAPDAFEAATMDDWVDSPLEAPGRPKVQVRADGEGFRYMRAIPTQGQCLACHGAPEAIAPDVKAAIDARYPQDRATGFAEGQMRGAFSIAWTGPAIRAALARPAAG
ncbi:MAG: DUF3365 domain-containing protein [Sphingomonadaceae bacterium]